MASITKLSDHKFEGKHPNNINEGYTKTINNFIPAIPVVKENYFFGSLRTSKVTGIILLENGDIKFTTENSTYLIKY